MSTRAQVIIKDDEQELWFYRHSDGYPKGAMPTLEKFLNGVKSGEIRDNVEQAAGWLILFGAQEYNKVYEWESKETNEREKTLDELFTPAQTSMGWKCGAYEPCACRDLHGDVEYLYTVDLVSKTITTKHLR